MTVLSKLPDGLGFYYGYIKGDRRRIDIRLEDLPGGEYWCVYIAGDLVDDTCTTKEEAEREALEYLKTNPDPEE
jgi:hypothetical protein